MKQLEEVFKKQQESRELEKSGDGQQDTAFIKFYLNDSPCITPIQSVKEILEYRSITPYPLDSNCHRGIINLRGNIIPIYNDDFTREDYKKRIIIFEPIANLLFGIVGSNVKRVFISEETYNSQNCHNGDVITFENTPFKYFSGQDQMTAEERLK
ncbi:MAG: chemotaxis protein CheW [Oligoflexia bacterium]|nr:chemotaxis protein CheW [Oligoflexia bacterium]MBF0364164.1 chemotaxis protein CheW [Oligoflexia bacterium]